MLEGEDACNMCSYRYFGSWLLRLHIFWHVFRNKQVPVPKIYVMFYVASGGWDWASLVAIAVFSLHVCSQRFRIFRRGLRLILEVSYSRFCPHCQNSYQFT